MCNNLIARHLDGRRIPFCWTDVDGWCHSTSVFNYPAQVLVLCWVIDRHTTVYYLVLHIVTMFMNIYNQIWGLDSKLVVWHSRVFVTRNLLLHNDLLTFGSKLFPRLISLIKICCSECQFIIKLCTAYTDCGCGCTKSIINLWFAKTVINIWSHRWILWKYLIGLNLRWSKLHTYINKCK